MSFENTHQEKFVTVDELAKSQNLIACYQMQVNDNNKCNPVYLGKYPEIPTPLNRIIDYNNHKLHVITYVLTEDEIKDKLYKIVGVTTFKKDSPDSAYSLDLVMNDEEGVYQLLFNDHQKYTTTVVENLETFPGRDKVLDYVIQKAFKDPFISILNQ